MPICFLFTEHLNEDGCLSLSLDHQGQIQAPLIHRPFCEIQTLQTNSRTYIVLPSEYFSLHKLALPRLSERKARAAIPFALEEKLAQPVNSLHFAFDQHHYENGHYLVLVTDKAYLQNLIGILDQEKIQFDQLTLDWFALMPKEIALMANLLLINNEFFQGALTADLAPFYLKKKLDEQTCYCFNDSNKTKLAKPSLLKQFQKIDEPSQQWIARRLLNRDPINLCQGDLQHRNKSKNTKWLYHACIAMTILWLLSVVTVNSIKLYFLHKDIAVADREIAVIYRAFFPQSLQVINPKFRISQLLKTNQSTNDLTFWILLNKLAQHLGNNLLTIEQLHFQNQILTLRLRTKDFETLEGLQTQLQKSRIYVKQTQASSKDGQVIGTLELSL